MSPMVKVLVLMCVFVGGRDTSAFLHNALAARSARDVTEFCSREGAAVRQSGTSQSSAKEGQLCMKGGGGGRKSKGNKKGRGKVNPALQAALEKWEPVIGIEIHAQISSSTKAYCSCSTLYSPDSPNTNVCPVCLGEPGSLPVPNARVVELSAKAGMALGCTIAAETKWDRKNYFYPDTPKNYQITQYDRPIAEHGEIVLPSGKKVGVTRLHMEEDSAKMNHQGAESLAGSTHSLVDFNRAGTPLAEIVSEPDMRSGIEAAEYGRELQRVLRYLGVSDGNMAEGSMRLDVNVSLRPKGEKCLNTKVELKNLNSFRAVQESVDFEIVRQSRCYETDEVIRQETRLWDEKKKATQIMRVKEGEADYRYFPEPDIPPLALPAELLQRWRSELCELPAGKRERYQSELGLSEEDASALSDDQSVALYFEEAVGAGSDPGEACKWLIGDIAGYLNSKKKGIREIGLTPSGLAELVGLIRERKISGRIAKELLPELLGGEWEGGVEELVEERGMQAINDPAEIEGFVRDVMKANADKVEQFRSGKTKLQGFFVGQAVALSGGKADPELTGEVARRLLEDVGVEAGAS
ncbi:glutamyl-tRNA(Gln) amidotransferase, B subunit [Ectocarpus siliculosus]|uniref:Glutamyl-tRNA(Gln) amidotransferase subunit B, mitochondrial n=1 Tax=Ectocarpus siliculosus TaxID=2880 RepID=D8LDP1_ECTSI|nr:glutamyl-tRNA(Gln) amidotransferase, B subunit [Ectocarpus siliculosus]|eukprot:CBN78448.1 glutamyl-tRNA(Gln) amidotransferase, B subunit [Ectocarpus siliculosus]